MVHYAIFTLLVAGCCCRGTFLPFSLPLFYAFHRWTLGSMSLVSVTRYRLVALAGHALYATVSGFSNRLRWITVFFVVLRGIRIYPRSIYYWVIYYSPLPLSVDSIALPSPLQAHIALPHDSCLFMDLHWRKAPLHYHHTGRWEVACIALVEEFHTPAVPFATFPSAHCCILTGSRPVPLHLLLLLLSLLPVRLHCHTFFTLPVHAIAFWSLHCQAG